MDFKPNKVEETTGVRNIAPPQGGHFERMLSAYCAHGNVVFCSLLISNFVCGCSGSRVVKKLLMQYRQCRQSYNREPKKKRFFTTSLFGTRTCKKAWFIFATVQCLFGSNWNGRVHSIKVVKICADKTYHPQESGGTRA